MGMPVEIRLVSSNSITHQTLSPAKLTKNEPQNIYTHLYASGPNKVLGRTQDIDSSFSSEIIPHLHQSSAPNILHTYYTIYTEALPIFYGSHTFHTSNTTLSPAPIFPFSSI